MLVVVLSWRYFRTALALLLQGARAMCLSRRWGGRGVEGEEWRGLQYGEKGVWSRWTHRIGWTGTTFPPPFINPCQSPPAEPIRGDLSRRPTASKILLPVVRNGPTAHSLPRWRRGGFVVGKGCRAGDPHLSTDIVQWRNPTAVPFSSQFYLLSPLFRKRQT